MQSKDDEILYWRDRYFSILNQNQQLREKNAELIASLTEASERSKKDQELIENLQSQIKALSQRQQLDYLTIPNQQIDELAQTLCGSSNTLQSSISKALSMKQMLHKETEGQLNPFSRESNTPKANKLFEEFFILGISEDRKVRPGTIAEAEVLYQYPSRNITNSSPQYRAIGNFSFPSGVTVRYLGLTESASDVHEVLRPHQKREGNSFVFTLKSNSTEEKFPYENMANSEKELLYCCCVIIEDLSTDQQIENTHIIIPKCYCLVSYCPTFELHFEILYKILAIKQIQRLSSISERSPYNRGSIESVFRKQRMISDEEIGLLQDYYTNYSLIPTLQIMINLHSINDIYYSLPSDLSLLDSSYFCPLLFSLLEFKDFFWLLCALIQEKSVVFVSRNLDYVSSCVLGFYSLLRPFNWTHLLTPILPESLKDVLEAPVPLLVGLPTAPQSYTNKKYSHIIWVILDEPKISKRILRTNAISKSVKEPFANNLKNVLSVPYKKFTGRVCYTPSSDQKNAYDGIIDEIGRYWQSILELLPRQPSRLESKYLDIEELGKILIDNAPSGDVKFLEKVVSTQIFINAVEKVYHIV
ncbi:unnamed protein product [Blepharisma stoltei]|uniref:UDENN domain-containing protein n=1 Tax=Blepharisma stoltei TaxID=1481888 RepID=A0AAU9J299_9CILI|nr:unnamed protein product [Blepharisma stoltei]